MKKLLLLDAFALIFRSYYMLGNRFLYNSKGFNTTACLGFTNTLNDLIKREKPTHIAIAWDAPGPTGRAIEHDFYKANRDETPEDIKKSIPVIRKIIAGFDIPILELSGYEADDIVGTVAKQAEKDGFTVFMVTPDKDYAQLVSENIFMYKPGYKGKKEEIYGVPEILEKWQIRRIDQVIDILGLMGDAVDNIPGIKGVGAKTAIKLLDEFDTIENLLENTDQLKGKLKEKVEADKENAIISKHLATIILDVPVAYNWDEIKLSSPKKDILTDVFNELEFRTLGKKILGEDYSVNESKSGQMSLFDRPNEEDEKSTIQTAEQLGKNIENTAHNYKLIQSIDEVEDLLKSLLKQPFVVFDTETTGVNPMTAQLVGLSFSYQKGEAFYVPIKMPDEQSKLSLFKSFFENDKIGKGAHNLKYDLLILKNVGIELQGPLEDSMISHYLLAPDLRHKMDFLAESYLGYSPVPIEKLIGKKGKSQITMDQVPIEDVVEYAAEDADITLQLIDTFSGPLKENEQANLYHELEMPLITVLAKLEYNGVRLDCEFLNDYSKELETEINAQKENIFELSGTTFNMNSPSQLGPILFDKMEIPYSGKKTKTGKYSTNEETLRRLKNEHPIIQHILEYRETNKLKNTYVDVLPNLIHPKTGKIHTTFAQAVASTGRLSSNNPNLQNIPIRTERGRKIRKAFIPNNENFLLFSADYSQVELRIMASMSEDPAMIDAFENDLDIHAATAAKVYQIALEDVTREMRSKAKMVNFGIIYGITAFGLSQRLDIPRGEASELIKGYFKEYPGVKSFMDQCIENATKNGYAETIMGRRRQLNDIYSKNRTVRSFAERNAINAPIQGSAADIIKKAMIDIDRNMTALKMQSKMILQVHDELIFDVYEPELDMVKEIVEKGMSQAVPLKVPLKVESGVGQNWLEAH